MHFSFIFALLSINKLLLIFSLEAIETFVICVSDNFAFFNIEIDVSVLTSSKGKNL